jgi:hypothetical protein
MTVIEHPDSMACERCADATEYFRLTRLADDFDGHIALFQCPDCGDLFQVVPELKRPAMNLSVEEARARFPGAI